MSNWVTLGGIQNRPGARRVGRVIINFFHWKTLCVIPTMYKLCNKQSRRVRCAAQCWQKSVTLETFWREVVKNVAFPPASEIVLPNDNSKLDCVGGKFKLLPEYLTKRDV